VEEGGWQGGGGWLVCAWHTQVGFSGTEMGPLSDDNRSFATAVVPAIRTIAYGKAAKLGACFGRSNLPT